MPNHLKAWRTYRRLTGAALARAADTSRAQVSKLEKKPGLSSEWLRRLAPPLECTVAELLEPPPAGTDATASQAGQLDLDRLRDAIAAVELALNVKGLTATPKRKAEAIATIYIHFDAVRSAPPNEQKKFAENVVKLFR